MHFAVMRVPPCRSALPRPLMALGQNGVGGERCHGTERERRGHLVKEGATATDPQRGLFLLLLLFFLAGLSWRPMVAQAIKVGGREGMEVGRDSTITLEEISKQK